DSSWGQAYEVGADFMLRENLMINAKARYIHIDTIGKTTLAGVDRLNVDIDLDPIADVVGLGSKFSATCRLNTPRPAGRVRLGIVTHHTALQSRGAREGGRSDTPRWESASLAGVTPAPRLRRNPFSSPPAGNSDPAAPATPRARRAA